MDIRTSELHLTKKQLKDGTWVVALTFMKLKEEEANYWEKNFTVIAKHLVETHGDDVLGGLMKNN